MTNRQYTDELQRNVRCFFHEQRMLAMAEAKELFDNPDIRIAYIKLNSGQGFMEAVELLEAQSEFKEYLTTLNWDVDSSEMLAMKIVGFSNWLKSELINRYAK